MGFGKFLACVVGGAVAVVAAPIVLPAAAAVGAAAATAGGAIAGAAGAAAAAAGSTAIGGAVAGAASAVAGAAGAAATAVGSTAVGSAVAGAATAVGGAVAGTATAAVGAAGATGVAAAIGAGATYSAATAMEGVINMEEANSLIESARREYEKEKERLDTKIQGTTDKLAKLNEVKMQVYATDIKESIKIIEKIKVPKEKQIDFIDNKEIKYFFNEEEIKNIKVTAMQASEIVTEISKGASFMKAAAGGTLGFMSQFGIASTGTAISSLSGAAATNATLAALGGGSLAAGGGGMALGSSVLGGVTLLPAAMILSWNYAKESEKALTEARAHHAKIKREIANMERVRSLLAEGVDPRVAEVQDTIQKLSAAYQKKVFKELEAVYKRNKDENGQVHFKNCSKEDQEKIKRAVYFVRKIKDIVAVKVLEKDGKLSPEGEALIQAIKADQQIIGIVNIA